MTETTPPKKSDLGIRTLSAIVMVAVAGTALWLGGWVWIAFVAAVALGVLWEWWGLVRVFQAGTFAMSMWMAFGFLYVGLASLLLAKLETYALVVIAIVIAIDVGAYFFGRAIGGPKIAPKISPSKTWTGLLGGVIGASSVLYLEDYLRGTLQGFDGLWDVELLFTFVVGALLAVVAQAGDFFESWMKRRAGKKDSSQLIPGHGGLFDRVDGLLAVLLVMALSDMNSFGFRALIPGFVQ